MSAAVDHLVAHCFPVAVVGVPVFPGCLAGCPVVLCSAPDFVDVD